MCKVNVCLSVISDAPMIYYRLVCCDYFFSVSADLLATIMRGRADKSEDATPGGLAMQFIIVKTR